MSTSGIVKATHVYAGRLSCGCTVAAMVDIPDEPKEVAKSVAQFIRDGYAVARVTLEEFRGTTIGCKCGATGATKAEG